MIQHEQFYLFMKESGDRNVASEKTDISNASRRKVIAIESGFVKVLTNGVMINLLSKGAIIGLDNLSRDSYCDLISCVAMTKLHYYEMDADEFVRTLESKGLVGETVGAVSKQFHQICHYVMCQNLNDSYSSVKKSIEWLNQLPFCIRSKYTAISFIEETTAVSRSHALSIIKNLKIGNYIKVDQGYLKEIIIPLPERY